MSISEVIRDIDSLSDLFREEEKSSKQPDKCSNSEIIEKLAYESIIKYAVTNDILLKGFDFKRYKSDNDYIWYDELIMIINAIEGLNRKDRDQIVSSELSFFFGYLRYKLKYADFSYNPQ